MQLQSGRVIAYSLTSDMIVNCMFMNTVWDPSLELKFYSLAHTTLAMSLFPNHIHKHIQRGYFIAYIKQDGPSLKSQ